MSRGLPVSISTTLHMRESVLDLWRAPRARGPTVSSETKDYNTYYNVNVRWADRERRSTVMCTIDHAVLTL